MTQEDRIQLTVCVTDWLGWILHCVVVVETTALGVIYVGDDCVAIDDVVVLGSGHVTAKPSSYNLAKSL